MAERWQGKGTKEAKGYGEKIDTAWDDFYVGDKNSSGFNRKDFRKFIKVAGGLGVFKFLGDKELKKSSNEALARANDIRFELLQEQEMLKNDIRDASVVGNRERAMQEAGYDYTDPAQIMDFIVNDPNTGLKPKEVAAWKAQYGDKGVGLATDTYNWENGSVAREIFNNDVASRVVNIFNEHTKKAAKYKALRSSKGFMPYVSTTSEGDIIRDEGYLSNVRAAIANIDTITADIKKDVEGMKWTDGILLKLGIKKLDRDFIIKEQISKEINKQAGSEIKERLRFDLRNTNADENLIAQLELRIQNNIDGSVKDMEMSDAFKTLEWITKPIDDTDDSKMMSEENFISILAEQAVTNTLEGSDDISMTGIIKTLPEAGTYLTQTEVKEILEQADLNNPMVYEKITTMLTPEEGEVRPFYTAAFEVIDYLLKNPDARAKDWSAIKAEAEAFKYWYSSKIQNVTIENDRGKIVPIGILNQFDKVWEINPEYVEEAQALGLDELSQRRIFREQGNLFDKDEQPNQLDTSPEFSTRSTILKQKGGKSFNEIIDPTLLPSGSKQEEMYNEFVEKTIPLLLDDKIMKAQIRSGGVAFLGNFDEQDFLDVFGLKGIATGDLFWDATEGEMLYLETTD